MKNRSTLFCSLVIPLLIAYSGSYGNDPVQEKYMKMENEKSVLGKPLMKNPGNAANGGKYQRFKKGNIYWHPNTDAWAIHEKIMEKYKKASIEKIRRIWFRTGQYGLSDIG